MSEDLGYPIGEFDRDFDTSPAARAERLAVIRALPSAVADAVAGLNEAQLDTRYRPDGCTVRQTVHHLADSHSNSLTRFKLALTEEEPPTIRPYYEERWAELGDSKLPIDVSIKMLESLHTRWVALLESMTEADYQRAFIHPETGEGTLEAGLGLYAWGSQHHTETRPRKTLF